jgi:type VI secretion system protein ImpH
MPTDLGHRIVLEGYRFDFFQLVHLLETWQQGSRIGGAGPYRAEALRLHPDDALAFSPADVRRVEEPDEEERRRGEPWSHRVTVNFMGLYGVASPSPVYLSELIGFTDVDAAELKDFLDLFNHRLLSLFYRAWLKYRYPYRYEAGARDEVSGYLLSLIGLGDPAVRRRTGLPEAKLLRYLGLLALRTRPPVGLELLVADYLRVATKVEQRVLRWVAIPKERRNRIGTANCRLGVDLSVGERVPDRAGKFRLSLGPLHLAEYVALLPGTTRFATACALARLWAGERFDHDVELILRREEVPELQLAPAAPARLGWTSWVTSGPGVAEDPRVVLRKADPHSAATPRGQA